MQGSRNKPQDHAHSTLEERGMIDDATACISVGAFDTRHLPRHNTRAVCLASAQRSYATVPDDKWKQAREKIPFIPSDQA